ncbi:MAG: hypothetical protein ABI041_01040 [Bdellovibrionia bacterium]
MKQIADIAGGWELGVDYSALVWLTVTSVLMIVGPAIVSMIYLGVQDRSIRTQQPALPVQRAEEFKKAA